MKRVVARERFNFLSLCLGVVLYFHGSIALANPAAMNPTRPLLGSTQANPIQSMNLQNSGELHGLPPIAFNSKQLGLEAPLNIGITYSDLTQSFVNGQYVLPLGDRWAIAALGEYGQDQNRFGGTVGFALTPLSLVKVSAERLTQNLPFQFDSGNINQKVSQNAFGARVEQGFNHPFFQDINAGGYYALAQNQGLSSIIFSSGGSNYINYRNIAGASAQGLDAGTHVLLTRRTQLGANLYYDAVHYNTTLTGDTSQNQQGMGGGLSLDQLLGPRFKVFVDASARKIYDSYEAGVHWLPPLKKLGLEISLVGQHINSHNPSPNSNQIGIQVDWIPEADKYYDDHFEWGSKELTQIADWVQTPAVHMDRVLAIAEQITQALNPGVQSISPSTGNISGGVVTITGSNLASTTGVSFGGTAATIQSVSATQLQVRAPESTAVGPVNVVITTSGGTVTNTNAYTYTVAVGNTYLGGRVYQVSGGGLNGNVVYDTNSSVTWNTQGNQVTPTSSAANSGNAITTTTNSATAASDTQGSVNTSIIVASGLNCQDGSCAALTCSNSVQGGASQGTWYLPAAGEFVAISSANLGFSGNYWSSTQSYANNAWLVGLPGAGLFPDATFLGYSVLCARAF